MKRAEHTQHCEQVLGRGFQEVHDWLDELSDKLGPAHRRVRHTPKGVKEIIEKHGFLAGAAACLHIYADMVGIIMTKDGKFEKAPIIEPAKIITPSNWDTKGETK